MYGIQILIPTLTLLDKTQFLDQPGGASNVYRSLLPFLSYNFLLIIFLEIAFSKIWGLVAEESTKRGGERKWIQVLTGTLHLCPFSFLSLFSFLLFTLYFGPYLSSLFLYSLQISWTIVTSSLISSILSLSSSVLLFTCSSDLLSLYLLFHLLIIRIPSLYFWLSREEKIHSCCWSVPSRKSGTLVQ